MKILGVIPARYESIRFPGKPLAVIGGQSMIQRVYRQASKAGHLDKVIVGTDDERIFDHVRSFGGEVMMTDRAHESGTQRCAEVARKLPAFDIILNIQGDEPFIAPSQIDLLANILKKAEGKRIATLAKKIRHEEELLNPNVVKVVFNLHLVAMYFSRHPIPYINRTDRSDWLAKGLHYKHIGMYGFQSSTLQAIADLSSGHYFSTEGLEQLKWMENGYDIHVEMTEFETLGIDTPEDLERAIKMVKDEL